MSGGKREAIWCLVPHREGDGEKYLIQVVARRTKTPSVGNLLRAVSSGEYGSYIFDNKMVWLQRRATGLYLSTSSGSVVVGTVHQPSWKVRGAAPAWDALVVEMAGNLLGAIAIARDDGERMVVTLPGAGCPVRVRLDSGPVTGAPLHRLAEDALRSHIRDFLQREQAAKDAGIPIDREQLDRARRALEAL